MLKLEIEYDFDFEVIGIVSSLSGYQLAWSINNSLKIDLSKEKDIELNFTSKKVIISNYIFEEENNYIRLIKNKSAEETLVNNELSLFNVGQSEYFLPELKRYDFIVQIEGIINTKEAYEIVGVLNALGKIELANLIDLDDIKEKDNLIFE